MLKFTLKWCSYHSQETAFGSYMVGRSHNPREDSSYWYSLRTGKRGFTEELSRGHDTKEDAMSAANESFAKLDGASRAAMDDIQRMRDAY